MNILDDMPFHLARIQSIKANLQLGNILPTIYGDSINDFGYASSLFYPDLLLYIPAILALAGLELIRAYQIFLVLITITTAVSMYFATNRLLSNLKISQYYVQNPSHFFTVEQELAILATLFYIAFPYRLINIYLRGALGEILSFVFLPIVAWGLTEVFCVKKGNWRILTFGMLGLLYSHVITTLMVSICILMLIIIKFRQSWQQKYMLLKSILMTAFLSAAFLLPLIEQMQSNQFYYNVKNPFGSLTEQAITICTPPHSNLLLIIYLMAMALIYYCYVWLKKKQWYPRTALLFLTTVFLCIMTTNLFPWSLVENIPLMKYIQFPWRIFLLVAYSFSMLCAIVSFHFLARKFSFWYFSLTTIAIISGFLTSNILMLIADNYAEPITYKPPVISIGRGEYLPAKFNRASMKRPATPIPLTGELSIERYAKTGNKIDLIFSNASNELTLEFPVIYYIGYNAYLNNKRLPISQSENGLVQLSIQAAKSGHITIQFEHSTLKIIAYIISITTLAGMFFRRRHTSTRN
jgi:hypothetical protein